MIEEVLLNYLTEHLPVPCYLSMPENFSGNFCVLEKTGSGYADGLYSATLAVQSYGTSDYEAARLNHTVVQALQDADTMPELARCQLNTDYNFPDTTRKRPRYQAVFDVVYYEA